MKYMNKKTRAVIETACVVSGGDWVKVEEQPKSEAKTTVKKATRKKSGE